MPKLMHKGYRYKIEYFLFLFFLWLQTITPVSLYAQETNTNISGRVFSNNNEILPGATLTVIHEPTQNKYISLTRADGYFHFFESSL